MKVSVITINLNNKDGLKKTIDSVLVQTFRDFEWIVIDGGSSDGSFEVIKQYSHCFSYWVSEPDRGVYNAMNKGIKAAEGEYVIFMNSGDCFADADLLMGVEGALDCDIVAGSVRYDNTNTIINPPQDLTPWQIMHQNIPHQAEFIRKSLFDESFGYSEDLSVLSDFEFNLHAAFSGRTYRHIQKVIAIIEQGGLSNTQFDLMKEESTIIRQRIIPRSIRIDYEDWLRKDKDASMQLMNWAVVNEWPIRVLRILYRVSKGFNNK